MDAPNIDPELAKAIFNAGFRIGFGAGCSHGENHGWACSSDEPSTGPEAWKKEVQPMIDMEVDPVDIANKDHWERV